LRVRFGGRQELEDLKKDGAEHFSSLKNSRRDQRSEFGRKVVSISGS
jgi:hypothetical protein